MQPDIDRLRHDVRKLWRRNDAAALTELFREHPDLGREWLRMRIEQGAAVATTEGTLMQWLQEMRDRVTVLCNGVEIPGLWDERRARHFAADCAEHVLPLFEKAFPRDLRPRLAIEVARANADELIPEEAMWDAAMAAHEAQRGCGRPTAPRYAAISACYAAGENGPEMAALDAAYFAQIAQKYCERGGRVLEQAWQERRLLEYFVGTAPEENVAPEEIRA